MELTNSVPMTGQSWPGINEASHYVARTTGAAFRGRGTTAHYRAPECRHPFPNLLALEKAHASAEAVESIYLLPLGLADIPLLCYVF